MSSVSYGTVFRISVSYAYQKDFFSFVMPNGGLENAQSVKEKSTEPEEVYEERENRVRKRIEL